MHGIIISIILKLSLAFPTSVLDLHINTLLCLSFFECLLPTYSTFTNKTGNPLRLFRYIRKKYNLKLLNNEINLQMRHLNLVSLWGKVESLRRCNLRLAKATRTSSSFIWRIVILSLRLIWFCFSNTVDVKYETYTKCWLKSKEIRWLL